MLGRIHIWREPGAYVGQAIVCLLLAATAGYAQVSTAAVVEMNPPRSPPERPPLAIIGARLVDGLGGRPVDNAVVIVEAGRITAVGSGDGVDIPDNADRFDARGKTVMPGLIDAHFHSIMNNELLSLYLGHGVTAVRDPGHPIRFYQSLHFAEEPVPRVFLTGAHLDGFPPLWPQQAVVVRDAEHARQAVHEHAANGATGIKIYYRLPLEYYQSINEAAKQLGIPVMAHLELVDADDAIRAGVGGIEHVTSFGTALADVEAAQKFKDAVRTEEQYREDGRFRLWSLIDVDADRVREVVALAASNDVVLCPTLALFERRSGDDGVEDYHVQGYQNMVRFVRMAHEAGIKIAVGSHVYGVRYAEFGSAFQREMEVLVSAGLTPMEVVVSSTMGNARYLGVEDRLGSIERGKVADLLLIEGDPTEDISVMSNVYRVMLNGEWVESNH